MIKNSPKNTNLGLPQFFLKVDLATFVMRSFNYQYQLHNELFVSWIVSCREYRSLFEPSTKILRLQKILQFLLT